MRKIYSFLISSPLMGSLFLVLAVAMGVATFIENDFGTSASKALIYNSWWFEGVFALLAFNLFGNLLKHRMFEWSRLPVVLFHASFFVIIIGAGLTRYVGYEGMMHIREGESSSQILSSNPYIHIKSIKGNTIHEIWKPVYLSTITPFGCNVTTADGISVESVLFVPNASLEPVEDPNGIPHLVMVGAVKMSREERVMIPGQAFTVEGIQVGFEPQDTSGIHIRLFVKEGGMAFVSKLPVVMMQMQSGQIDTLAAYTEHPFYMGILYRVGDASLVMKQFLPQAVLRPVYREGIQGLPDAVVLQLEKDGQLQQATLMGIVGEEGRPTVLKLGDTTVEVSYGSKPIDLPFALRLTDFQLERYPGSHSPSSFTSEVVLEDDEKGIREPRRIFMNNILNYRGYRFFQSSYDQDELGTVLSVNRDPLGTTFTYIGYFLMALGMMLALALPNTRFRWLYQQASKLSKMRKALMVAGLVILSSGLFAQRERPVSVDKAQAREFGKLWVQDNQGRVEPLNTLNSEIARKLVKHNTFKGMSADEFVLGILTDPMKWQSEPLITVSHPQLRDMLKLEKKKASFRQFFTHDGTYLIGHDVENAYRKKPSARDKFDQEVIKVDEQVNVFYMVQAGKLFKLFPDPTDSHLPWRTSDAFPIKSLSREDSLFVRNAFPLYIGALIEGNTQEASGYANGILAYQQKYGTNILPSEQHKQIEIFYNNLNLFMLLMPFLMGLGGLLLLFQFTALLMPRISFKRIDQIGFYLLLATFVIYTAGLVLRWYISGHAPWSNGYESMLYIGYCTFGAGLLFSRKNNIALSVSALFTSIILMVAHLSWMNPEITNLVPVLKSYWLTIHVAVIVASYGFLGLGALLAFVDLLLLGLKNSQNRRRLSMMVDELSAIAEMSMTVGLYLLTIGAFLGGVWANESWGRYWGWDPKETWSAVTILIYALVLHMRMIPGMKGQFVFNFMGLMAFGSVIMTYLGVNYYLAGMHSYAKGDPLPIPDFVYYTIATIAVVAGYAWYNERKLRNTEQE
ncbi:MAG: cytochrome c biogenesis protein CcsA [Breznakibacter sp.]